MNKEKQIEEMIKEIEKCSCLYTPCDRECAQCSNVEMYDDSINHIARTVYEAGYRKASEVAREIFEEIEKITMHNVTSSYGLYLMSMGEAAFAKIKKKYTEGGE